MDVQALYTNIPNHEGIEGVKEMLNQTNKSLATQVIIKFLYIILTMNNFLLNGINYLQTKGCAMGTIYALPYANGFIGKFGKLHIYPYIRNIPTFYCEFIDNIISLMDQNRIRIN